MASDFRLPGALNTSHKSDGPYPEEPEYGSRPRGATGGIWSFGNKQTEPHVAADPPPRSTPHRGALLEMQLRKPYWSIFGDENETKRDPRAGLRIPRRSANSGRQDARASELFTAFWREKGNSAGGAPAHL